MSSDAGKESRQETNYLALGICVGMVLGGALGILYGFLLDNMPFMYRGRQWTGYRPEHRRWS